MAAAAVGGHREALYSLAVIQFNGSGGSKDDRDLRAGARCARARRRWGTSTRSGSSGTACRTATACAAPCSTGAASSSRPTPASSPPRSPPRPRSSARPPASWRRPPPPPLVPPQRLRLPRRGAKAGAEAHAANRFLVDWFASRRSPAPPPPPPRATPGSAAEDEAGGLRLCSHALCGRPETRRHEFRRCSVCGVVNYCSGVPGAALEDGAQGGVHAHGPVARQRRRRRRQPQCRRRRRRRHGRAAHDRLAATRARRRSSKCTGRTVGGLGVNSQVGNERIVISDCLISTFTLDG